jgi:hypothetical protein
MSNINLLMSVWMKNANIKTEWDVPNANKKNYSVRMMLKNKPLFKKF